MKNLYNNLSIKTSFHLRDALKSYDLVVANTQNHFNFISKHFKTKQLMYFPENSMRISKDGILSEAFLNSKYSGIKKTEFIWCGSLDSRKMPNLLIDAVKLCKNRVLFHITVIGGGYLYDFISNEIRISGLQNTITLTDALPRNQVAAYFEKAHVHILTSAYDANTTVMFEAMENCVPSISFDHFGMADLICDKSDGRKISVDKYEKMCLDLAAVIDEIVLNPDILKTWSLNLCKKSFDYTAEKRAEFFEKCYEIAIKNHRYRGGRAL